MTFQTGSTGFTGSFDRFPDGTARPEAASRHSWRWHPGRTYMSAPQADTVWSGRPGRTKILFHPILSILFILSITILTITKFI